MSRGYCAQCAHFFPLHPDGLCPYCHYGQSENVPENAANHLRQVDVDDATRAASAPVPVSPLNARAAAPPLTPGLTPPLPEERGTLDGPSVFEPDPAHLDLTHGNPVPIPREAGRVRREALARSTDHREAAQAAAERDGVVQPAIVDPGEDATDAGRPAKAAAVKPTPKSRVAQQREDAANES